MSKICRKCEQALSEGNFYLGASMCNKCSKKRYQQEIDDLAWRNRPHTKHQWRFIHSYDDSRGSGDFYSCTDLRCGYDLELVITSVHSPPGYYISTWADWYLAPEEELNIMQDGEEIK